MSEKKSAEKSPYRNHTIAEVMEAEAGSYYIQVGNNLFESESGKMAFSKNRAEHFYLAVWQGLRDMKESGISEEIEEAEHCLLHFRIIPLKFH